MSTWRTRPSSLFFIAIVAVSGAAANANNWNNSAGGSFSTGSNWAGGLVPGLLDTASFNLASQGYTVTLSNSPTNAELSVGNDTVTLDLHGNAYTLASLTNLVGTHSVEVGSASGGSLTLENTGSGTSSFNNVYTSIGVSAGQTGTVTITGHNMAWNASEFICVGDSGIGTLDISNGAKVTDIVGSLGSQTGSNGTAILSGSGASWSNTDYFYVGNRGMGTLTVQNGASVSSDVSYIGRYATGFATVTGTGSSWQTNELNIGYSGPGTLNILNGATVTDTDATMSATSAAPSTVTVGSGSTWNNSGGLTVGSNAAAVLNIQGTVNVNNNFAVANHIGTQVNLLGGTLSIGFLNTSSNPSLLLGDGVNTGWTGGTLKITRSDLTIGSGGQLGSNLSMGSGKSLQITGTGNTLSIAAGSKLNAAGGVIYANTLNNAGTLSLPGKSSAEVVNPLVNTGLIDIPGGSLQLDAGLAGASVRSQIASAYDGGKWDGTSGIGSSLAATSGHTALAYVTTGTTTKINYTWVGDANGDGIVNGLDIAAVSPTGTTWQTGDFNYDGVVNADDWALLSLGMTFGSSRNISTVVPEPAVFLALVPMIGLVRRRRNSSGV